jgi:hypothetical protein
LKVPAVPRTWGTAREATAVKTGASRGRGRALGVMIGRHGSSVHLNLVETPVKLCSQPAICQCGRLIRRNACQQAELRSVLSGLC